MPEAEGTFGPFALNPPAKVQLDRAPLAKVLCQIRWPELTRFKKQFDAIAESIGNGIAGDYPLFAKRQQSNIIVGPDGVSAAPGMTVYEWSSPDGRWHVHFGDTFATIETGKYTNKEDLIERLRNMLAAVAEHASIPSYNRIGYRYMNCVDATEDIESLIRTEVRGGEAVPVRDGVEVARSVTETLYRVDEDQILARWAQLPSGTIIDPGIPPLRSSSWILDLDAFHEGTDDFDPNQIAQTATRLANRGYTFFRWSVTERFLDKYGAKR